MTRSRCLLLAAALLPWSAGHAQEGPAVPARPPLAKKRPAPKRAVPPPSAEAEARLAAERAQLERLRDTTVGLIRMMVQEGVLPKDKAAQLLGEGGAAALADVEPPKARPAAPAAVPVAPSTVAGAVAEPAAAPAEAAPTEDAAPGRKKRGQTVRVPYVPEVVKQEIREQLRQDVLAQAKAERWAEPGTLPEWLDRIVWEGDMRLRYEGDYYQSTNVSPLVYNAFTGANLTNTQNDQGALRMRLRLGMLAKVSDTLGLGIRLATGALNSPVSTNQTLGSYDRGYQIVLDRAYVRWDPSERVSLSGGRIPNPWFWPTDLVWDEDLNFEGVAAAWSPRFGATGSGFVTAGVFPLQKNEPTPTAPGAGDKWLYGVQAGAEWNPGTGRLKLAAALFDYRNLEGRLNTVALPGGNDWTVPPFRQKGNTVFDINQTTGGTAAYGLAAKFRVLNLGLEADLARFDPLFLKLAADYARNIGFDREEIRQRTGLDVEPHVSGYQARLTAGAEAIRARHDWQAFAGYRRIERDALPDAFTDSDFYLGGTDTRGWFVGGYYGLDRNAHLRVRYMTGSPIHGTALGNGTSLKLPLEIDVLQADFNVRF